MRIRTVAPIVCVSALLAAPACEPEEPAIELSADRIVLTPGGSATIRVNVARPEGENPPHVHFKLFDVPDGVEATLSEKKSSADHVMLEVTSNGDEAFEGVFLLKVWVGPYHEFFPINVSVQIPTPIQDGVEEFAPGVNGEVVTLDMNGEELTYEVINGMAIADGDIVLGEAEALDTTFRSAVCNFDFHTEFSCSRWTDGVIGYNFANDWGDGEADGENARMRGIIHDAMDEWEANTGIRFVERYTGEYIRFHDGDGCSSTIGRAVITGFDSQGISLANDGCDTVGIAMHEIGHAIGLYHEQSRNDRDDHVVVDFGRVRDGKLHNFFTFGEYQRDRGGYNFDSIMHYKRWHFARNKPACMAGDLSECTVRPFDEDQEIGQRDYLSDGDIYGAYVLYPPEYTIIGADPGETGDHFFLLLDFDTPPPNPSTVLWRAEGIASPLGTGLNLEVGTGNVGHGPRVITAEFRINNITLATASIALNMVNDTPVVSLAATNGETEQDLGAPFGVSASVNDTEDGSCPAPTCEYSWTPTPSSTAGGNVAFFTFDEPGTQTVTVEVEDAGGEVGTASLEIDVVNTAPTATITQPNGDLTVSIGTEVELEGIGHDLNESTGTLPCDALTWSSSSPGDTFFPSANSCSPNLQYDGGGVRTISLVATDPQGVPSVADTVEIAVAACDGNCAPTAFFSLSDPHDNDTYFVEFQTVVTFTMGDLEASSLDFEFVAQTAGEPDVLLFDGPLSLALEPLRTFDQYFQLENSIGTWTGCENEGNYREYDLVLTATDGEDTTVHSQTVTVGCSFN